MMAYGELIGLIFLSFVICFLWNALGSNFVDNINTSKVTRWPQITLLIIIRGPFSFAVECLGLCGEKFKDWMEK